MPVRVLAVDLAATFSALVLLDDDHLTPLRPTYEGNSFASTETEFCYFLTRLALRMQPDVVALEDLPYHLPGKQSHNVMNVYRLQGRIIDRLEQQLQLDRLLFVPPAVWQVGMSVSRPKAVKRPRGALGPALPPHDTKARAAAVAVALGYTPPDLLAVHADAIPATGPERIKVRAALKKLAGDHTDAALLAYWLVDTYQTTGTFDAPLTSRYTR